MKSLLPWIVLSVTAAASAAPGAMGLPVASDLQVRTLDASGKVRFEIVDHLKLPKLYWPRTLLSYPVRFEAEGVVADRLRLLDRESGAELPLQLSQVQTDHGALRFAVVNFFSDLPCGGTRRFELSVGMPAAQLAKAWHTADADSFVLAQDKLSVRVPKSHTIAAGETVPGPILQLNGGGGWIGRSTIASRRRAAKQITTEIVASGPLFTEARVSYAFDGGGSYVATLRNIAGYDFLEFGEEMGGLSKEDGVAMEIAWTGFHPTHRWSLGLGGVLPIDKPHVQAFRGEDPAFTGPSQVEDPARQMLMWMEITPSNGWSGWKEVDFWDERTAQGMGLFIQDVARWQDHEYAIWVSSETLRPQFRYAGGVLYWKWPLVTGTRATGVVCGDHPRDTPTVDDGEDPVLRSARKTSPAIFRRSRYGDLSLNRVKDWILDYPASAQTPGPMPGKLKKKDAAAYDAALATCGTSGIADGMYHPVALRDISSWLVPDYSRLRTSMTPAQRERATAMLLLSAYLSAQEDYGPLVTMLGGHPNFMADYKYPLLGVSYLFPEHPRAAEWRDQFEKFVDLSGRYYTRPAVPAWEACGGRWTESIATYNWAFLSPTLEACRLGIVSDRRNRIANPSMASMGQYLVGVLTAPVTLDPARATWPENTPLTPENGFPRIHPPQGAHSGKRGIPGSMYALGENLMRYRPLVAEHLLWGGAATAGRAWEDRGNDDAGRDINRGTNPHLRSAKYTGYGLVMRAAVDTPDEISVFLQQIDKGPNYRWGYANQNGSGDIYYYAQGRSYSGHGFEDAGDRHADDALHSCNTGVYKNYHFDCIGMNELTRPFYGLSVAQFAELVPQEGPGAYSWPEYKSRSVMLVGSEYIVVYDAINGACGTRFAWNSSGVNDELPCIYHLKGGNDNVLDTASRARDKQHGVIWDVWKGGSDRMMLVTHKKEVQVVPPRRKRGQAALPYHRIKTSTSEDLLFQDSEEIVYADDAASFRGTAGVIRHRRGGATELALFHGSRIGVHEVTLDVDDPDLGVSAAWTDPGQLQGDYFTRKPGRLTIRLDRPVAASAAFYVEGEMKWSGSAAAPQTAGPSSKEITVELPGGAHHWELTGRRPQPNAPTILRTENRSGGARVLFSQVAGAERYRMEISRDGGLHWEPSGETVSGRFELQGLTSGTKVHVRAVAVNAQRQSEPGLEYPIYVTDQAPLPPDGLQVELGDHRASLSWGEVLGASEYRLYRRERGKGGFAPVFHGLQTAFVDCAVNVAPPLDRPGHAGRAPECAAPLAIFEYAVSAVNGNGEGIQSPSVDTDPASWRNWNPPGDRRFKRQSGYWLPPYVLPQDVPPQYYP